MARFMEIEAINLRLTQKELFEEFVYSTSSLQRYRQDKNMLSLYRIPPNSHKRRQKILNREHDLERPQMTSNDFERPQLTSNDLAKPDTTTESTVKRTSNKRNKNVLKAGSVHGNVEINDKCFDEFLHNNTL